MLKIILTPCYTVISELDGLSKQPAPLGPAAASAVTYLEKNIRSAATSLKVQTAKGNYLSDLAIRTEDFSGAHPDGSGLDAESARAYTVDDFILRVASFQSTSFVDRSNILGASTGPDYDAKKKSAVKVLLLSFDRNLRLRARARGITAATKDEMAKVLGAGG